MNHQSRLTFIIGCTSNGKGSLARALAQHVGGEIISIDSMKVYRRMDIGTAKPSLAERRRVPHHLIDVADPSDEFSVARYVHLAGRVIREIQERGRPIFVVGGTPLYIKALTEGLFEGPGRDERLRAALRDRVEQEGLPALYAELERRDAAAAERIHPNDERRIVRALEVHELTGQPISDLQRQWGRVRSRYDCRFIGLRRSREDQNRRSNERVRRMIDAGLVEEVRGLIRGPRPLSRTASQAVGYSEIIRHFDGEVALAEAVELIKINTRRLAKSQRTWFKRFLAAEWIDLEPDSDMTEVASSLLQRFEPEWSPSPK